MADQEQHPEQVLMAGGRAASSKIPHFHLIPTVALERLAERCELGERRKPGKAWNATSANQEVLLDRDWLIERLSHVIYHAMKLRDKIVASAALDGDDDASAIMWGGMFAVCATDAMNKESK